jgi:hypothetical protein
MALATPQAIEKLLQNTIKPTIITELVSHDATYIPLTYSNPELKKILPYSGVQERGGPAAVLDVFSTVNKL